MLLRHPWDTQRHLGRIVNGIDTVPRVMKNEFPCRDVNTNDLNHDAFAWICFDPPPPHPHICVFLTLRLMCFLSSVHTV